MIEKTNDVEKGGICMLLVGIQFSRAVIENSMKAPQKSTDQTNKKLKIGLPCYPDTSLLNPSAQQIKSVCQLSSLIYLGAPVIISGTKNQFVYQRIKLYMCIHMHNIYTAQYCPIIKKIKSCHCDSMNGPGRLHIK